MGKVGKDILNKPKTKVLDVDFRSLERPKVLDIEFNEKLANSLIHILGIPTYDRMNNPTYVGTLRVLVQTSWDSGHRYYRGIGEKWFTEKEKPFLKQLFKDKMIKRISRIYYIPTDKGLQILSTTEVLK